MSEKINPKSLFNLGYGLYILTAKDGDKDNACIINAVMQLTDYKVAVAINKQNFTHDMVKKTGLLNVNCVTEDTPFEIFEYFGFKSGKDTEKRLISGKNRKSSNLHRIHHNIPFQKSK